MTSSVPALTRYLPPTFRSLPVPGLRRWLAATVRTLERCAGKEKTGSIESVKPSSAPALAAFSVAGRKEHSRPYSRRSYEPDATTKRFGGSGVRATGSAAACAALPCAFFDLGAGAAADGAAARGGGLLNRAFLTGADAAAPLAADAEA